MAEAALDTFPRLLLHHATVRPGRPAIREKDLGIWQTWTWAQAADAAARTTSAAMSTFLSIVIFLGCAHHRRPARPAWRHRMGAWWSGVGRQSVPEGAGCDARPGCRRRRLPTSPSGYSHGFSVNA